MSGFIVWQIFVIAMLIGGIVGGGLCWWLVSREISKAKMENHK